MIASNTKSILERVIDAGEHTVTPALARTFLAWNFSDADRERMEELSAKARSGELVPDEAAELEEFCVVGDLLSILHLRAGDVIQQTTGA